MSAVMAIRSVPKACSPWYTEPGIVKMLGGISAVVGSIGTWLIASVFGLPMEIAVFAALLVALTALTITYSRLDYIVQREIVTKFAEARQQPDYPNNQKPLLRSRLLEEALDGLQRFGLLKYAKDIANSEPENDLDFVENHPNGQGKPGGNLLHDAHHAIFPWNRTANTSLAKHGWSVRVVLRMVTNYYNSKKEYDTKYKSKIEQLSARREALGQQVDASPTDKALQTQYRLTGDRLRDAEREASDTAKKGGPDALFAIDRQVDRVPELKADLTRRLFFIWLVARQATMAAAIIWGSIQLVNVL